MADQNKGIRAVDISEQTVAFIGLGNMGGPMVANLCAKGFSVRVFDVSNEALQKAADAGCAAAASANDAVAGADVVVTMLPNGEIVESLLIDEQRLLEAIHPGALLIDCSTVAAATSSRVHEHADRLGLGCLDAPVSGGVAAAKAGTLAFMCGGTPEAFQAAQTVLAAMGTNIFHAGEAGAGQTAKICNNMLLAVHMAGTAEALQMGVNNGLDPAVLSEIMRKSSGGNWSLEKYNPYPGVMPEVPASNDYAGGFLVRLMLKDLGLAANAGNISGSKIPMGDQAHALFRQLQESAEDAQDKDFSSILKIFQ